MQTRQKHKLCNFSMTMIKLRLILCTFLAYLNLGCSFFVRPKTTFVIKNQSSHDINISIYKELDLIQVIEIRSGDEWQRKLRDESSNLISPFHETVDSVVVKFDNSRALFFYCDGIPLVELDCIRKYKPDGKNPMVIFNEEQTIDKFTKYSRFTLTYDNSDYERAVEL